MTSTPTEKRRALERKYGLQPGQYEWLSGANADNCWICGEPETVDGRRLAIDHDHETGAVRGLLCTRCNQVLGRVKDDPKLLRRAAKYLEQARAAFSDGCSPCMDAGLPDWIHPPAAVVETDGVGWTRFGYVCNQGHRWTCGWATEGVPFSWQL